MAIGDETRVTEITIAADGRIYVFGASRRVLRLLSDLQLGDPAFDRRARLVNMASDESMADDSWTSVARKEDR